MLDCDVIVAGLGIHGSSSCSQLAGRGVKVIGFEKYQKGSHSYGSSHGMSRIIRQAYFEDPSYVPLLKRSFELWRELETAVAANTPEPSTAPKILTMTGALMIGKENSSILVGTLNSVRAHNLDHEVLTSQEIRRRFRVFETEDDEYAVYESEAGYLNPETCVIAYQDLAIRNGAELHFNESIVSWRAVTATNISDSSELIEVKTSQNKSYLTKKLVLSVGAWAPELYGSSISLRQYVERRVLYWFHPTGKLSDFQAIPVYIWDLGPHENFYGFPCHDMTSTDAVDRAVKVAYHQASGEGTVSALCSPGTINRQVSDEETESIRRVLSKKIPLLNGELKHSATCMYTSIADDFFLIDFHPHYATNNVLMVSACSGHGFKFGSVIGEIVADLTTVGTTRHNIEMFRLHALRK